LGEGQSLIGPRALPVYEVDKIEPWQRRRLSMRPGLTCLWQINGRNKVDFENWIKLDLQYLDNWSI
jgi:lipopolysaccharide/colanic/teichoic acid biosynthesis glycosyltransferase